MAEKTDSTSWFNRLRGRQVPDGTDWGDLGTAIGMEMTICPPNRTLEPTPDKGNLAARSAAPRWWSLRR